jgi:hypothetical protein
MGLNRGIVSGGGEKTGEAPFNYHTLQLPPGKQNGRAYAMHRHGTCGPGGRRRGACRSIQFVRDDVG